MTFGGGEMTMGRNDRNSVKVTKSGRHLLHDRASKGNGSIPGLKSQISLHASFQRLTTTQIRL